jgi:hypothetical protein
MEHLGQPLSMYVDQPWNTWVSLKVFESAMEQLGQLQGTWISNGTLGSASRFLYQLWNTWVSLKVLGSAMEQLGQPQGF